MRFTTWVLLGFAIGCCAIGCSDKEPTQGVVQQAATTTCTNTQLPSTFPPPMRAMTCHGLPAYDPVGDVSPAIIDAVGDTTYPVVYTAVDANFLYLRIRVNENIGSSACSCASCVDDYIEDAHGWGFDFDTDGNPQTYEFQLLMNGANTAANRTLELNLNLAQAGAVNSPNEKAETVACIYAGADADARIRVDKATDGSNFPGTAACDFFVTLAFPLAELSARGYNMKSARLVWAGSSAQAQNLSGDIVCDDIGSLKKGKGDPEPMCFNCCTADTDCTAGRPAPNTNNTVLTAALLAAATTASVVSTAGYASTGLIVIDSENIRYTGITATTFTGLTRGVLGSTAANHSIGAMVDGYYGEDFCNAAGGCECSTAPDSCPTGQFCDPLMKTCRKNCTSAAPQGGNCPTSGDMTLCCDDGNSCTTNACNSGKCEFVPTNQGMTCEDDSACTGSSGTETATCNNGTCGSLVVTCTDDGQLCTSDICSALDATCQHPTRAAGSACRAAANDCDAAETCNGTSTSCPGDIKQPPNTPCSDGNACTSGEICNAGGVCGDPTGTVTCTSPPFCSSTVGATCNPADGMCSYPTSIFGQSCTTGAGGTCNCSTAVCDSTGNSPPGLCEPAPGCGNGTLEMNEGCDDGNTANNDGCNSTCEVENTRPCNATSPGLIGDPSCASGICDMTGGAPGVCEPVGCGNGVLEAGEGCDDGNTAANDGCNAMCKVENSRLCNASVPGLIGNASCASGVCDMTGGAPGVCKPAGCGNSLLETGEGCDDGNNTANDGCNTVCKVEDTRLCNASTPGLIGNPSCASGICDMTGGAPGVCERAGCGNSVLETGEGCDDGNTANNDGCNSTCKVENTRPCNASAPGLIGSPSCASGVCDMTGGAPGVCEPTGCGNGLLEAGEGCDDGNTANNDGCNSTCKVENTRPCNATVPGLIGSTSCASGVCDMTGGAPGVCEPPGCGDGVLETGEGCDDGNTANNDGCNSTCKVEDTRPCNASAPGLIGSPSCASGVCDMTGGAPGVCEPTGCGNGLLAAGEGCDDGNTANNDGCNSTCKVEDTRPCNASAPGLIGSPSCASGICDMTGGAPGVCEPAGCGDGRLQAGEGCDDGNTASGDGCNSMCKVEDTRACNATAPGLIGDPSCASGLCDMTGGAPGVCGPAACGDGRLQAGEGCDDGNTADGDLCSRTCKIENNGTCNATAPGLTGDSSCEGGNCDTGNGVPGVCGPGGRLTVRGGGCQTGGGGGGTLLVVLAFGAVMRRRRRWLIGLAGGLLALVTVRPAAAQLVTGSENFPVERMRVAIDRDGILGVEWAGAPQPYEWNIGTWLGYANDPLVVVDTTTDSRVVSLVHGRVGGGLFGGVGITRWLELGLEMPLIYAQNATSTMSMVPSLASPSLGDLRLAPKLVVRQGPDRVAVAIIVGLTVPTGGNDSYAGDSGVTFSPELVVSRAWSPFRISGNLGYLARKQQMLLDLAVDDEIYGRMGIGYRFAERTSGWNKPLEIDVTAAMATPAGEPFSHINTNALELGLAAQYDLVRGLTAFGLVGVGLNNGYGTPDWRVVLGARYSLGSRKERRDTDGDAIYDDVDACANEPEDKDGFEDVEGCPDPDNDKDTILDTADKCPNEPEDMDGFEDVEGCPDPDNDKDTILDTADRCPNEPEDMDGFEDVEGCPDPDNDKDGVPDVTDKCPMEPGPQDNKGCPDPDRDTDTVPDRIDNCPDEKGLPENQGCAKKQLVTITNGKLELLDRVYFRTNKDIIEARSNAILDNVAKVLAAHPEIDKVRVEGHTDNRGGEKKNRDLSQRRAAAVVKYLVRKNIGVDRLVPVGFGQDLPIDTNDTDAGRATNRRVEFVIVGDHPAIEVKPTGPTEETIGK